MMLGHNIIYLAILCLSMLERSEGGATFMMEIQKYSNPSGLNYYGRCCDILCSNHCDHDIRFCLDTNDGYYTSNVYKCREWVAHTGRLGNTLTNYFYTSYTPIIRKSSWPSSGLVFKVYVRDHDSLDGINPYSDVDKFVNTLTPGVSPSVEKSSWQNVVIQGLRSSSKTSLQFRMKVYCDQNFYGPQCDISCEGHDDHLGHYTCDPSTGNKVCLPGWEEPAASCNIRADDCVGSPCMNNGTCLDGLRSFSCQCPSGWAGTRCEVDVDLCVGSGSCVIDNTIQCIERQGVFICHCKTGYVGPRCEFHVCQDDLVCQNGGTCVGNGECFCVDGYTGANCQYNICNSKVCYNGGKCNHGRCYCPRAYTGEICEVAICNRDSCRDGVCTADGTCVEPCKSKPCQNQGTCYAATEDIQGKPLYHCRCLPQYNGDNCEIPIVVQPPDVTPDVNDTCKDVTCFNNGQCYSGTCQCPPPYQGDQCQNVANYCTGTVCQNGGTCYSGQSTFFCACQQNYTGQMCELAVSTEACQGVQCMNAGKCVDGACQCSAAWMGDTCEKQIGCLPDTCKNGGSCFFSTDNYLCVCGDVGTGQHCETSPAPGTTTTVPPGTAGEGTPGWVIGVVVAVVVILVIVAVVVVLLLLRRRKRKNADKATGMTSPSRVAPPRPYTAPAPVAANNEYSNPAFNNGHDVYENVEVKADEEDNYADQNDINLNIVPRGNTDHSLKPVYGADGSDKPPLAKRSQSYDGFKSQNEVSKGAYGKDMDGDRRPSAPDEYSYAKVDGKSTKSRELKTPKHLEERYEAMKAATVRNELK